MKDIGVYIEDQRVQLFKDEDISIVSSVQNIEDISRTFNDYSQSFTVPGSSTNNKIFEHYYEATVDDGFDARIRHSARIDIDGIPFKVGAIRLEGCEIALGKIAHYKITFFGLLIDLKEVIGDDYLNVLDFSDFDLSYTSDNVKTGLITGLESGSLIFPMISTKRQWFYNSLISDTTYTAALANIAWNGSGSDHGMDWESFRPALLISDIIDKIESQYGLTFSDDFLADDWIGNLYLWLANSDSEEALKNKNRITDYTTLNLYQPSLGTFNNTTGEFLPTEVGAGFLREIFLEVDSTDGIAYSIRIMNGDTILAEDSGTGDIDIIASVPSGVDPGSNIYAVIVTTAAKTVTFIEFYARELSNDLVFGNSQLTLALSGATLQIYDFMPQMKILDFLKGIFKMYNLTVVPTSSTEFTVETLDDWYAAGEIYDISQYVDRERVGIKRSKIYKEIAFKFQDPTTILADEYKRRFNTPYGDLETKLKDANGTQLDGGDFEIEVPFEQMVYEKLINTNTDINTNIIYGLSLGPALGVTTPKAHIFYGRNEDVSGNGVGYVNSSATKEQINTTAWMPAHTKTSAKEYSTVFGSEIDEHDGGIISNSLYLNYYKDYITDSFNMKRRIYSIKANFPVWLLTTLKLNDRLVIDGNRYIINSMTTNITKQTVQLELLNDIYNVVYDDVIIEEEETVEPEPEPTPVGTSFSISANGFGTSAGACSDVPNATKYANTVPPNLGTTIYNDIALSSPFDGNMEYYKLTNGTAVRVAANGFIIEVFTC